MKFSEFKKIIFNICNGSNITIHSFYEAAVTPNFHAALLEYENKNIYLLCSYNGDWAFSNNLQYNELKFTNCSELSIKLKKMYGINVSTESELHEPFSSNEKISESDIKYWKPKTIGEGLFNWWD